MLKKISTAEEAKISTGQIVSPVGKTQSANAFKGVISRIATCLIENWFSALNVNLQAYHRNSGEISRGVP